MDVMLNGSNNNFILTSLFVKYAKILSMEFKKFIKEFPFYSCKSVVRRFVLFKLYKVEFCLYYLIFLLCKIFEGNLAFGIMV
jgi:hypothetical protein